MKTPLNVQPSRVRIDHAGGATVWRRFSGLALRTLVTIAAGLVHCRAVEPPGPVQQDIFVSGTGGYHTYRIPALILSRTGTVLAFAEGRKSSRADIGDIDLLLRRSLDGGRTWLPVQLLWDDGQNTCGNPTAVVDRRDGTIWLIANHNLGTQTDQPTLMAGRGNGDRTVWVMKSTDDGATWSRPVEITSQVKRPDWGFYATGPGVGIQTRDGRLVIPSYYRPRLPEGLSRTEILNSSRAHIIYSDDAGKSWKIGGVSDPKTNECQIVELESGSLLLNMRSFHGMERRAITRSTDGGLTWGPVTLDSALIEPTCQASLIRHRMDGKELLLFSNPASTERKNMGVRFSRDGGATWSPAATLHPGPAAYSCLAALDETTIACLYERSTSDQAEHPYEKLTFARFDLRWLTERGD